MEIDCQTVKARLDAEEDFLLLDCREQPEVETAALPGATWIPLSELIERHAELEPHRERDIVVYCHLGGRSLHVATWLKEQGFRNPLSMSGGIDQWSQEIDPSIPRY